MAKAGRPKHEPTKKTRLEIQNLTIAGATQAQICELYDLDLKTLRKYYREELDTGASKANGAVVGALYQMATSGQCPAASIFWAKTRLGWREKETPQEAAKDTEISFIRGDTRKSQLVPKKDTKNGTE